MSAPVPSKLDGLQIIQSVFDETAGRIRVDAELTSTIITPPALEVLINSIDDNISIRNSNNTNELLINSDGSINVNTSGGGASDINLANIAGAATSVGNGISNSGTQRIAIASDNNPLAVTGTFFQTTQPVSGVITANAGTDLNTSSLNLETTQSAFKSTNHTDLLAINTTLGSPFQAGASIGNTVFGISGTLPAFTSTPTFNLGTISTAATAANQTTIITTLGSPFQAGGSIGNTTFASTQSGTWNITNISGTITLPTGASTSLLQTTSNSSLATIATNTTNAGTPVVSGTVTANAGTNLNTSLLALDSTVAKDASLTTINTSINTLLKPTNTLSAVTTLGTITNALPTGTNSIGQVTANAGTNLNTSLLALDSTVAKDASLTTLNTSVNSLLKPASTLTAVTTLGTITNALPSGSNVIGHVITDSGSVTNATLSSEVAQGSTTSGQNGILAQTATTTSAPTYVTAKTNPLSTDVSGNLRVSVKDSPANTNKFLVTADAITFASPQHVIADASSAVIGHVIVDTAPSTAVTNTGTFAVQATLAAETTKVIGTVNQGTSPWVVNTSQFGGSNISTGTGAGGAGIPRVTISNDSSLAANQSVNNAQINGVAPLMGNGGTGTGSQRVTIASDNTAFSVNASSAQSGTWTVQPGNTANTTPWLVDIATSTGKSIVGKTGNLVTTAVTADQVIVSYTVTSLKTFYLEHIDLVVRLTTFATTATSFGTFSLETPSGTKIYTQIPAGAGVNNQIIIDLSGDPIPLAAGVVVRLVCTPSATTSFTWQGNLLGFEK